MTLKRNPKTDGPRRATAKGLVWMCTCLMFYFGRPRWTAQSSLLALGRWQYAQHYIPMQSGLQLANTHATLSLRSLFSSCTIRVQNGMGNKVVQHTCMMSSTVLQHVHQLPCSKPALSKSMQLHVTN